MEIFSEWLDLNDFFFLNFFLLINWAFFRSELYIHISTSFDVFHLGKLSTKKILLTHSFSVFYNWTIIIMTSWSYHKQHSRQLAHSSVLHGCWRFLIYWVSGFLTTRNSNFLWWEAPLSFVILKDISILRLLSRSSSASLKVSLLTERFIRNDKLFRVVIEKILREGLRFKKLGKRTITIHSD